jgi:hypothetical protein
MQPSDVWSPDTVFIETGLRDGRIGASLLEAGMPNYLGVSSSRAIIAGVQARQPKLARCVRTAPWRRTVEMNNAQVVILSGFTAFYLWRYRALRHADAVAWSADFNPITLFATIGWLVSAVLFRRFSRPVLVTCRTADGQSKQLFACRILRRRPHHLAARHYIPHAFGLSGLFKKFEELGVSYAVLRWFEGLPQEREGRDIDLMVGDEKFDAVLALLNSQPGIELADVYTPSGLPKSDYYGTPYYPTASARQLLARTCVHNNFCRVPSPLDHFHSLAYHVIYHHGPRSGIKSRLVSVRSESKPAHDYEGVLRVAAERLGIQVELTLEGIHEYLGSVGWAPKPDMLARMAAHYTRNPWLKTLASKLDAGVTDKSLTVFCIRQKAVELGFGEQIIETLNKSGFHIVATKRLSDEESHHTATHLRGGTWDKGVFPTSGGLPSVIVVAYDPQPIVPTRAQKKKDPNLVNARQLVKYEVRKRVNAQVPPHEAFSAIHSTDFGGEAWYCLELCMPERLNDIKARVADLRDAAAPLRRAA